MQIKKDWFFSSPFFVPDIFPFNEQILSAKLNNPVVLVVGLYNFLRKGYKNKCRHWKEFLLYFFHPRICF
jgi:hypothetical protein